MNNYKFNKSMADYQIYRVKKQQKKRNEDLPYLSIQKKLPKNASYDRLNAQNTSEILMNTTEDVA